MQQRSFGPTALVTPANGVTVARLISSPVFMAVILTRGASWGLVVAWVALAGSDGVDGWVARHHGTTRSGAFLDPLADKFLVLGAFIALAAHGAVEWLPVGLITLREVTMSAYRSVVGRRGRSVPARPLAKVKTWVQDLAVMLALVPGVLPAHRTTLDAVVWLAVALTFASALEYVFARTGRGVVV